MKVLIASDLAPEKIGSLECQIFSAARLLEREGAEAHYLFSGGLSTPVRSYFELAEERVVTNLGFLEDATTHAAWVGHFRKEQPDIIWLHFFPVFGSLIYRIRRACPRSRICVTDHVSRGFPRRSAIKTAICRSRSALFTRRIDRYIAVSRFVAQRLRDVDYVSPDRIHTVYNGVDLQRFHPRETEGSYIAAVCYMRPEKGLHVLLEALAVLKEKGQEPECKLVGVGPELDNYRSFALNNDLRKVQFMGSRDDVPDILRGAMMTIVPSTFAEAFGLAAAESQAVGLPVIASNIGGLPEVVEDEVTGLLVPPGDAGALAGAISSLLADPARRQAMGKAGRHRAEQLFDLGRRAREITQVLTS